MDQLLSFVSWLFETTTGVACLFAGGMLFFFILALVLERKTHRIYFNHPHEEDED